MKFYRFFLNIIKKIVVKLYSKLILINILIIKKVYKYKLIYHLPGFGDNVAYYIFNYNKIINNNHKIFTVSHLDYPSALLFFGKKKIIKIIFLIPKIFPIYGIMQSVISTKIFGVDNYKLINHTIKTKHKTLLEGKLFENMHLVSKNLLKFQNKKYLLLHIKYYDNDQNDLSGSKARQTNDFIKITKILKFLKKKKI